MLMFVIEHMNADTCFSDKHQVGLLVSSPQSIFPKGPSFLSSKAGVTLRVWTYVRMVSLLAIDARCWGQNWYQNHCGLV